MKSGYNRILTAIGAAILVCDAYFLVIQPPGRARLMINAVVPCTQVQELEANNSLFFKQCSIGSEQDGVQQIRQTLPSNIEEQYAFSDGEWREIGLGDASNSYMNRFEAYRQIKDQEDIIVYHTHPPGIDEPSELIIQPSKKDLESMVAYSIAHAKLHPEGSYVSAIISPYGVTRFSLTNKGLEYLSQKQYYSFVFGLLDAACEKYLKRDTPVSLVVKANPASTAGLAVIEFTPFTK